MSGLFASGRIIDLILVLVVGEWIALALHHRVTGRGVRLREFSINMLSGVFLMLAVREALVRAPWPWVAACLMGALTAHAADIAARWRG